MSALPKSQHTIFDQEINSTVGFSKISVNQQNIFQMVNQKSDLAIHGMCKFDEQFEILYPLFRGLSEAGKPKSLNLRFSPVERAVYFQYPEASQKEVSVFFAELHTLMQKEVLFKQLLKKVIVNRNRFRSEQFLLQNALMDSA
ncbi:hypothetical protein [Algoriphagus sp. NG3]|uniref:hypothetical protein n=1 Tax=unclassified Algoriphagus TaxID=2641541 RepID=UPI002A80B09F|nr:hypothetical protein [Algoriphagus sp. NG3]WPR76981.1 hypothetical protein SLW71_06465 [Algoriphagus sp. NG3]